MREMWNDDVHLLYAVDDTPVTTSRFHHVVLFHSNVDQLDHLVVSGAKWVRRSTS